MKRSMFALAAMMATSLMAHDPTPACLANPLSGLSGNYVFQIEGVQPYTYGITGVFNARTGVDRGGATVGVLQITASSILGISIFDPLSIGSPASYTRLETDAGRYTVYANCTGGTLIFNLSSRPMQFDFWFFDGGRQIYIVSSLGGRPATGRAAVGTNGCPAGVTNPLTLLNGNTTFSAHGIESPFGGNLQLTGFPNYAIAGVWNATTGLDRGGNTVGGLAITATSTLGVEGSVARLEADAGRHQANADCSGGTLHFNLSSRPVQFDFWYADGFQRMYFISTSGPAVLGEASR